MFLSALVSLEIFAAVALIDGVYFHLLKYKLFARPDSRYEHLLHTIHAIFFPALVILLFLRQVSGAMLWVTVGLVAADFTVEMLDVVCERASRATIGGLSTAEYAIHVLAITSRVAAFTLALASRPAVAWSLEHSSLRETPMPLWMAVLCWAVTGGGVIMAAVHLWLLRRRDTETGAQTRAGATA